MEPPSGVGIGPGARSRPIASLWPLALTGESVTMGRGREYDLVLLDGKASRRHARILIREGWWFVEHLGSGNGTRVNGEQVTVARRLQAGDETLIGETALRLKVT